MKVRHGSAVSRFITGGYMLVELSKEEIYILITALMSEKGKGGVCWEAQVRLLAERLAAQQ
jgi:hypothetical protein